MLYNILTLPNIGRFSKFTVTISRKFAMQQSLNIPPYFPHCTPECGMCTSTQLYFDCSLFRQ